MALIRLECPRCRLPLPAEPGACFFACQECGRVWRPEDGALMPLAATVVAPERPAKGRPLALLPVWLCPVALAPGTPALPPTAVLPPACCVPALLPDHGHAVLKLGRRLSLGATAWRPWPGGPRPRCGGHVSAEDARALADTIALACLPATARRRLLETEPSALQIDAPVLHYLPFTRLGARLRALVGDLEVTDRLLGESSWERIAEPLAQEQAERPAGQTAMEPAPR